MLEEKDIKKIGEEMGKVIEQNITPVLDEMKDDINDLKLDVGTLKSDVTTMKSDVDTLKSDVGTIKAEMVTKSYLDDKMADLEGNLTVKLRKEDGKVNRLIAVLKDKSVLSENDVAQFKDFQVFPRA